MPDTPLDRPQDQPPRLRRFALILLEVLATLVALLLLALGVLCARLAIGPMSTDALTPVIARALSDPARGLATSIAHGELAWDRDRHALYARLDGLIVNGKTGEMVAAAPDIEARLSVTALLQGSVKLDDISVRGAHLRLERLTDGQLVPYDVEAPPPDTQPAPDFSTLLDGLPSKLRWLNLSLTHLGRVALTSTRVSLTDRTTGDTQTAALPDLTLGQNDAGRVTGEARIALALDPDTALETTLDVSLKVDLDPQTGAGTVGLHWEPIRLSSLSGLNPGLAFLAGTGVPLGGQLEIAYNDPKSSALRLELQGGAGPLHFPNRPKPVAIESLKASFTTQQTVKTGITRARLSPLQIVFPGTDKKDGPILAVTSELTTPADDKKGTRLFVADATLDGVPVDQVPGLWPPGLAPGALEWVAANMHDGALDEAKVHVTGSLVWPDLAGLQLGTVAGNLAVSGVTVSYFGDLPPVKDAAATATLDANQMKVTILGGNANGVVLQPSEVTVGYATDPETIDIAIRGTGAMRPVLEVIDSAPLNYAKRIGVKPADVAGNAGFALRMTFPLLKELPLEQIRLGLDGTIKGFATSTLLRGIDLANGDLKLALDATQLTVNGPLTASGVLATANWHEVFDPPAGQPASVCDAKLAVDRVGLVKLGLDDGTAAMLTGTLPLTVKYQRFARGVDQIEVTGDLTTAGLNIAPVSYQKQAGTPGSVAAKLRLQSGAPIEVTSLAVTAPALTLKAHGLLSQNPLRIQRVQIDQGQFGATSLAADLTRLNSSAEGGWRGTIKAGLLDVSSYLVKTDAPPKALPSLDLTIDADKVVFGTTRDPYDRAREATGVHAGLQRDGRSWQKLDVGMQVREVPFSFSLVPNGGGYKVNTDTPDLGAILRATDQTDFIIGGKLSAKGASAAPGAAIPLTIQLDDYRVRGAPFIAGLVSAISAEGLLNALSGQEGLGFGRLRAQADWQQGPIWGGLHINTLKTSGGALGLTAAGNVDLADNTIDLQGTAVPFNSVNSLLGSIPLVGQILGGSSGIFAAAYTAKGPIGTPHVSVNPLSILAPGFLRELFFVGDAPAAPKAE